MDELTTPYTMLLLSLSKQGIFPSSLTNRSFDIDRIWKQSALESLHNPF
jgi:hypothetical protein